MMNTCCAHFRGISSVCNSVPRLKGETGLEFSSLTSVTRPLFRGVSGLALASEDSLSLLLRLPPGVVTTSGVLTTGPLRASLSLARRMGLVPSVLRPWASSLSRNSATFNLDKAAGVDILVIQT